MASRWYRSLYWRIAIGFVAGLAAMLVLQAVLFVWVISQSGPPAPGQPPDRFAQSVAFDITEQLRRTPAVDLEAFIRDQYGRDAHPFLLALADGRTIVNGPAIPEPLIRLAHERVDRLLERQQRRARQAERTPGAPRIDSRSADDENRAGEGRQGFDGPIPRRGRGPQTIPVILDGQVVGVVLAPPLAPFGFLWGRYVRILALVASVVLVLGAAVTAFVVFGPARQRLMAVERAAASLGSGNLSARAPDAGGDEIAAVAAAFNAMADRLSASDRSRRQLLADVSHELMTPITAIRGYLETLGMPELPLASDTRERYLRIVGEETRRLEHLVGDLLDLARLEGGGGALAMAPVEVRGLFDRVVARHTIASTQQHVRFSISIEDGAESVVGDAARLEQALQNLAANALRFAPPDSAITLAAMRQAETIDLVVVDAGEGITAEHLPHIFDRFYKADPSRAAVERGDARLSEGSGLGLSIVKAIAERHGATVAVWSQAGRTEFRIHGLRTPGALELQAT